MANASSRSCSVCRAKCTASAPGCHCWRSEKCRASRCHSGRRSPCRGKIAAPAVEESSNPVDRWSRLITRRPRWCPSSGASLGRSISLPRSNLAPARTRATRCGPLTARQRSWAASSSLNAIASPAALEPGPLVTRVRSRTEEKVDSRLLCQAAFGVVALERFRVGDLRRWWSAHMRRMMTLASSRLWARRASRAVLCSARLPPR